MAAATERRQCDRCGKTLRANNSSDTCYDCKKDGSERSVKGGGKEQDESRATIARFRKATRLFGQDPDNSPSGMTLASQEGQRAPPGALPKENLNVIK